MPERLFKDKEGQLWLGFREAGLIRYRPEFDDFEHFLCTPLNSLDYDPLCNIWVGEIAEDLANDSILWIASHGVIKFNKITGKYKHFFFEIEDLESRKYINHIRRMVLMPDGKIYTGSWYRGLSIFDTNTEQFSRLSPCYYTDTDVYTNDVTQGIYQISETQFWINSNKGLQLYDTQLDCITKSYDNNIVKKIWYSVNHIDEKGRIWSKSPVRGLHIYNPDLQKVSKLYYKDIDDNLAHFSRKILEDTILNKLYVGAQISNGLYVLDLKTKKWECILPPRHMEKNFEAGINIWDLIKADNGRILVLSDEMIFQYIPGEKRLREYPLPFPDYPQLKKIIKDDEGNFWITGYLAGLMKLDYKNHSLISIDLSKHADRFKKTMGGDRIALDKNGNIWVREHDGLMIYRRDIDSLIYINYTNKEAKALRGMGHIEALENGDIWFSTRRALLGYAHADSLYKGILRLYGRKDGLKGNGIYATHYYNNRLLIFSDIGMQEFDPKTQKFGKVYNEVFGIPHSVSDLARLSSGEIALGNTKYISIFHPDSLTISRDRPIPFISSFQVFNEESVLDQDISDIDTVFLSHKENFFGLELSALGFTRPQNTQFRYMLEGFDLDWQDGTERKFASYTNVPGGEYKFILETADQDGNFSDHQSITYLFISTVWWKSTWFILLTTLLLVVLAYLIYKYRINQVRREERLRSGYEQKLANVEMSALRAQMNPHFIFNSLNSIEYYIINNEPERASDYLNRFSRLIRLILQNSKNTKVPLKDDLEALKLYIEMESMRFDNLFDYEVKIESGISMDEILIPPMLIQPYVENAIWHGLMQKKDEKGKLELTIRKVNGQLNCYIKDNGIGRDAADKLKSKSATRRKSYGMKITSDRLHMLNNIAGVNAAVNVEDLRDEKGDARGTKVKLIIPINHPNNTTIS
jgi:ligand-binding sensor domain-containing protein